MVNPLGSMVDRHRAAHFVGGQAQTRLQLVPLGARLSALSRLKAVVVDGRLYSKELLDEALSQHRERFGQPLYSRLTTTFIRLVLKLMTSGN